MLSIKISSAIKTCTGYKRNVPFIGCITLAVVFMTGDHVLSTSLSMCARVIQGGDRLNFYLTLFFPFLLLTFISKSTKILRLGS